MKNFNSLSTADRCKFNTFHSIHFDINILETAVKQLVSNPDPDFIACLSSKFSKFIEAEVLPLVERHCIDMRTSHDAALAVQSITKSIYENENEDTDETTHETSSMDNN